MPWISFLLVALTVSTAPQGAPVAAPFAGGALFVWREAGSLRAGIYRSGTPIAKSIPLQGDRCSIAPATHVAVTVCSEVGNVIHTTLIDANGNDAGSGPPVWDDRTASAAWNGSRLVIASVDHASQVTLQTWDGNLDIVVAPRWVFRFSPNDVAASVVSNGDGFLLAVQESWTTRCGFECPLAGGTIRVFPLDHDGNLLHDEPIVVATPNAVGVVAASDGRDYALVWWDLPIRGLHARRVAADGALLGDEIALRGKSSYGQALVWDGSSYDVVFRHDELKQLAPGVEVIDASFLDVLRLGRDLSVVSSIEMPLGDRLLPYAVAPIGDRLVIAYRTTSSRIFLDELPLRPRGRAAH